MFRSMKEIVNLLDEADEARRLATETEDAASVDDLLQYATALEAEAERLDRLCANQTLADRVPDRHRSPIWVNQI